jgi:hypothetical protein
MTNALLVREQQSLFEGLDLRVPAKGSRKGRRRNAEGRFRVGFATALAIVVERGRKVQEEKSLPELSRCPRCEKVGMTGRDFGTRVLGGKRVPQSWCRRCRSTHRRSAANTNPLFSVGERVGNETSFETLPENAVKAASSR